MHPVTKLSKQYTNIRNSIRYGCIFLFIINLISILSFAEIRISSKLGDDPYLIITSVFISGVSVLVFYGVMILILKINFQGNLVKYEHRKTPRGESLYN